MQWMRRIAFSYFDTLVTNVFNFFRYGEREWWDEASEDVIHAVPDTRAREGVSLQPVPNTETEDWDRARALSHWKADQDLVPESTHEVEEGAQDGIDEHCALPHEPVRPPLPVRPSPESVCAFVSIGSVEFFEQRITDLLK